MTSLRTYLLTSRLAGVVAIAVLATGVVACAGGETADTAAEPEAAAPEAPAEPEVISYDPAVLEVAGRSDDDHYRDEGFKPLEVYGFFGIEPGMTVVDLATSGMYNAHILSQIVGPEGRVIATSSYTTEPRRWERLQETFAARNVDGVLDNVEIVGTLEDIEADSVDVIVTVRNYHDIGMREDRVAAMQRFLRVLKPGGILGAIDAHTDKTDERDESVHRLNEALATAEITEGGFEFVGSSDVLYNADDTFDFDGRRPGDPIYRYFIHRWVLKFQKPAMD